MSLIKCPECKKKVSDTAKKCPSCGYNLKKNEINKHLDNIKGKLKKYKYTLSIILLILLLSLVIYSLSWKRKFEIIDIDGGKMNFCCPLRLDHDYSDLENCTSFDGRFCGGSFDVKIKNKTSTDYNVCLIIDYYDKDGKNNSLRGKIGQSEECFDIKGKEEKSITVSNPYDYVSEYSVSKVRYGKSKLNKVTNTNNEHTHITTTKVKADQTTYKGVVYDLLKLNNSKEDTDKYVEAINKYVDDKYKINYSKTTNERGWTFYIYKAEDGTELNLIFNNNSGMFHCLTIIEGGWFHYFTALREGATIVSGMYNGCYSDNDCVFTLLLKDTKTKYNNYIFELSTIANTHYFSIMSEY